MFKKLLKRLNGAATKEEVMNVMYSTDGIDISYQREKISWQEYELLSDLVQKLYDLM